MALHSLQKVQQIPISLEEAWNFFSNPANLQKITPTDLGFKTISPDRGEKMYPGQILSYRLKPILRIPMSWVTEITHVKEKEYFIDEQRYGPYRFWQHQHHFLSIAGAVEMTDIVYYKIPFWILGDLANALFVKNQLDAIFAYRYKRIEELFGKWA